MLNVELASYVSKEPVSTETVGQTKTARTIRSVCSKNALLVAMISNVMQEIFVKLVFAKLDVEKQQIVLLPRYVTQPQKPAKDASKAPIVRRVRCV